MSVYRPATRLPSETRPLLIDAGVLRSLKLPFFSMKPCIVPIVSVSW